MINLLPLQEKEKLLKEEKYKIFLILTIFFLFFLVSLSLIFFALQVYIFGQAESQRIITKFSQEQFEIAGFSSLKQEIALKNKKFLEINYFYENQPNFTELLERISKIMPAEIYLTNFSLGLMTEKDYRFRISLSGWCPTREILFEFKKSLKAEPDFYEVYISLSDLIKIKDIDFNAAWEI